MKSTLSMIAVLAAAAITTANVSAHAADYPEKPVTIIVPFDPGAATDLAGRIIADELAKSLGQRFLVENKPGAAGAVGSQQCAQAAPDGYTLCVGVLGSHVTAAITNKKLPYDPAKDFTPISLLYASTMAIAVSTDQLKVKDFDNLVAYVRENPGKVSYGTAGVGSPQHLFIESLKQQHGLDLVHVPYNGGAQAVADTAAGYIQMVVASLPSVVPQVASGKLRIVALADAQKNPSQPDVALVKDTFPGTVFTGWAGIFGPAGLPDDIRDKLNEAIGAALASEPVRAGFAKLDAAPQHTTPDELHSMIVDTIALWKDVAEKAGIGR